MNYYNEVKYLPLHPAIFHLLKYLQRMKNVLLLSTATFNSTKLKLRYKK